MNLDIKKAISLLENHSIVLCYKEKTIISDLKGILPMIDLINSKTDLENYSVADKIVGKAAAILFCKAKIKSVYAKTISNAGKDFLISHNIDVTYDTLIPLILNRDKSDICPMEKAVATIIDVEKGYQTLNEKVQMMKK